MTPIVLILSVFIFLAQLLVWFIAVVCVTSAANPYVIISLPAIICAFLIIRWYFLKTSRDVKRLEAIGISRTVILFVIRLSLLRSNLLFSHSGADTKF